MIATAPRRRELCWFCWSEQPDGEHNAACPLAAPIGPLTGPKIREWYRGYKLGYNDSREEDDTYVLPRDVHQYRSPSFVLGYDLGRDECERLVELALGDDYYEDPNEGYEYVTAYLFQYFR
jgi:hypothetical protein